MITWLINTISSWAIPILLLFSPLTAYLRGVKVYEAFVTGAEEGFRTAVKIIPYLVGMLVAISVFRASGAMDLFIQLINPVMALFHAPAEILPLAIMRHLSGGVALVMANEIISTYGPDPIWGAWLPPCREAQIPRSMCSRFTSVPLASANTVMLLLWG